MSISGVLIRFFFAYIVLMLVVTLGLHLLDLASNSVTDICILLGAVMWPCTAFGNKNDRYFNKAEKTKVVLGMIGIYFLILLLVSGGTLVAQDMLSAGNFLIALVFIGSAGIIHSICIYFFVGITGKTIKKLQIKKAAEGG